MRDTIAIDRLGRVVIPKSLRDRLGLVPGTALAVHLEDGRIVLAPEVPVPKLLERDGLLVFDLDGASAVQADHRSARDARIGSLVDYAMLR